MDVRRRNLHYNYTTIMLPYAPMSQLHSSQLKSKPMYTPNLRHLEVFKTLMKTRNLTETARLMHVTQPAVSQTLREFEAQLGIELFRRGGGRIRPTEEALALLPDVERLFTQVGLFKSRAGELRDTLGGQINIAATPVHSLHLMPTIIGRMLRDRPRLHVSLRSLSTLELVQLVKSEVVEIGFTFGPIVEVGLSVEPIFESSLSCFMKHDHPLASCKRVTAEDLEGHRLVILSAATPSGFAVRGALQRNNIELPQIECDSASAAVEIARSINGIALIDPIPGLDQREQDIVIRPFEPLIKMTVLVVFSRHHALPKIAKEFIRHAKSVCSAHAEALASMSISSKVL